MLDVERTRLALAIGNIKFTDERIAFSNWRDLKPSTPWGSLPILTLSNGTVVAQQKAILRLVGKETGLYPTDPIDAAKVDELMDALDDISAMVTKIGQGLEKDAKEEARKDACEKNGAVHTFFAKIDTAIGTNDKSAFAVGESMTIADLFIYCSCSFFLSGFFDGVPADAIDSFEKLAKLRKAVRSHDSVCKWYDNLDSSIQMPASFDQL